VAGAAALAILGYILYQASGLRLLRSRWQCLCELKAGQRRLYRDLEALRGRAEGLLARVPAAARPAPFEADDQRAMALGAELGGCLEQLQGELRSLDPGAPPTFHLLRLLSGSYWRRLREVAAEVSRGEGQRRALAGAQALLGGLATALAALSRKPQEVQHALAELQAMAEVLAEDIAAEERRGTAGLVALTYEVQALRAGAMEWGERVRVAQEPQAAQVAIEAEALRLALVAKFWELLERVQQVVGAHDEALDWQERIERALGMLDADLTGLRPGFAETLQPAARGLRQEQQALAARYSRRDVSAYREVAQQAWALMAQARALCSRARRLHEAVRTAESSYAACLEALESVRAAVEQEQRQGRAVLDLCRVMLERAARTTAGLQRAWADEIEAGRPADESTALAALRKIEALMAVCSQEQEVCRKALAAWQAERRRIEEALQRLENSAPEHQRLRRAWRELQRYDHANWPQVEADWFERYLPRRQAILDAAGELRATLAGGVAESSARELRRRAEDLEQAWQALLHEGQGVALALRGAQAAERQAREAVQGLRAGVERVAAMLEELPEDLPSAGSLRTLGQETLDAYHALEDGVCHPERACLGVLRDEGTAGVRERLEGWRVGYERLLEEERAALKPQMAALWAQWEPLAQRLAKAAPPSEVDHRALQQRWQELLRGVRSAPATVRPLVELRIEATALLEAVAQAQAQFDGERRATSEAEQRLATARRRAMPLRERLPSLLSRPHPQVVAEEWERSTAAWARAEALVRQLASQGSVQPYLARLDEATTLYREAHERARSTLVRLVRYAYLEDPEGMRAACGPLGRRWQRLGVTARERQIGELLGELEHSGQVTHLIERIDEHYARPGA